MHKKLVSVILISIGLLAWPAYALADVGYTTGSVNLRTGPGTGYTRVATLAAGTRVNILACQPNWCRVGNQGVRGWLSANYLQPAGIVRPRVGVVVRPTIIVRPPYGYGHRPYHRPHRPRSNCKIAPGFSCR
ncbi:SH3 domain-containing protein [Phyllobacterium sp. LjRoot231]|uniref:SH3 domain-containing protein n=1 Tax=Phyllobacterium sp. LjRoot231 TaxID=3342289 RepID=UPI003ECF06DE